MKLILVALDSSPRAPNVLATAIDLARRCGAKVRLVRVVGIPPEVPMSTLGMTPDGFLELLMQNSKQEIDAVAAGVPKEIYEGDETRVGTPWQAICQAATDCKADLIVIGSHGYSGLDKILGTTAAKVVNHSDCSVLVARPERS